MSHSTLATLVVTVMLVLTTVASVPVAAQESSVTVETLDPTDVSTTGATLNGNVTALENASEATVWFEFWTAGDPTNASETEALTATGAFSVEVDGLAANTTYVVVAHAETEDAAAEGAEITVTTLESEPFDVDTDEASDVTNRSATLNGQLSSLGGEDEATVWFEYWSADDPDNRSVTENETLTAPGTFDAAVTELDDETTYGFQAFAAANGTVVTGDEPTFTTGAHERHEPTYDGDRPFGRWLTGVLSWLVDVDTRFGQAVSALVTANNPGAEHRADAANPGGSGPPDDVGPNDDEHERGPPDHAHGQDRPGRDSAESHDGADDELTVTVDGDVAAGATVTVTVTHDGIPVENATVSLDDEVVGTTDADGQVEVGLPDDLGDEIQLEAESDDLEGAVEIEFEDS